MRKESNLIFIVPAFACLLLSLFACYFHPASPQNDVRASLDLSSDDIVRGMSNLSVGDYVSLRVIPANGSAIQPFDNLKVVRVYDKDGRRAEFTGAAPSKITLEVQKDETINEIVGALLNKKAAFIVPLGRRPISVPTPTTPDPKPTPMPRPTVIFSPSVYIFDLPLSLVKSDLVPC